MNMHKHIAQLESILQRQIAEHRALGRCVQEELAALRRADQRAVSARLEQENRHVQAIAAMEKERLTLVAAMTQMVDPQVPQPLRLGELAQRLEEPARGRLLALRAQLTADMHEVRRHCDLARQASQSLLRHMQGLMQTIGAVVTGVAVYGRAGAPPRAALAVSTFDARA